MKVHKAVFMMLSGVSGTRPLCRQVKAKTFFATRGNRWKNVTCKRCLRKRPAPSQEAEKP